MMYFAFLIPIIIGLIGYIFFQHKITIVELAIGFLGVFGFITISYFTMKSYRLTDTEYNSYLITEARYYEPYETYVYRTCTRQVPCGTYTTIDSKGMSSTHTKYCTETYDCSYCDDVPAQYTLQDTGGNTFYIDYNEYMQYVNLWKHKKPEFVELNRNINYHGFCGKDGDMYKVNWNGIVPTSVQSTKEVSFENKLKTNHSAFNYPVISEEDAKNIGLFNYPELNNYYQSSVVGLDSISLKNKKYLVKKLNYINGLLGQKYSSKVFLLVFKDKDLDIAFKQEAYWDGGNRNEVNICVGVDRLGKIKWVKAFSWVKNKRILVNLREDIINQKSLENVDSVCDVIEYNVKHHFKWRDFEKDFAYLTFEPSKGQLIFIYIGTLILSITLLIFGIQNNINPIYKNNKYN